MRGVLFFLILSASACTMPSEKLEIVFFSESDEVEVGGTVALSCMVKKGKAGFPEFTWRANDGEIRKSSVEGEVDFIAPLTSGTVTLFVEVEIDGSRGSRQLELTVLPEGSLKKTADVLITVDTATLNNVWVNASHSNESFTPPLSIKGTFRYDSDSGLAFAGGSWPTYPMYDDGTHGDVTAGDGIWSILMKFEKTDSKVYFAFDDANPYRVEYESGLAWTVKMAWIELDEYPDDHSNPAFTPDKDQVVSWTAAMAEEGGIYHER